MRGLTFAIAALAAGGCGGAGGGGAHNYDGVYRADTHTEDKAGCGDGAELGDHALFKLEYGNAIALAGYKYELCTSADACLDFGILSLLFTDEVADGWNDDSYDAVAAAGGGGCTLSHTAGTLRVAGSDGARVEFKKYSMTASVSDCSTMTAKAMAASLPCVDHEVLVGTKVK
jgi:hypothetical protein